MFYSKNKKNLKDTDCETAHHDCNLYEAARDSTVHLKNDIHNHPIRSTLIALAAGYVLGAIFRL